MIPKALIHNLKQIENCSLRNAQIILKHLNNKYFRWCTSAHSFHTWCSSASWWEGCFLKEQ